MQKETKKAFVVILLILSLLSGDRILATDYTSTNFTVTNPVINPGTASSSSGSFGLGQSLSQTAIGQSTSASFQLWSGFQYFFKVNANVLTATADNGEVDLSWTVPQTFLGITISSYEVGVGTVSGTYTFTDRGNVTSYTQTGLTNGTQYYFRIKAKAAGGVFLVFSNEATATPTAPVTPPPSGGGGGGGVTPPPPPSGGNAIVVLSGLAYPGRSVTVLKDGAVAATTTADPAAQFSVTISNLTAGVYSFSLYATDNNGKNSPTLSFLQSLTSGVTTEVKNLFLGPTLGVSHSIIKKGETLNIFGYTTPSADVTIITNSSHQHIDKVTADTSGAYFKAFNTLVLEYGGHSSYSQSAKDGKLSPYSVPAEFEVAEKSVEQKEDECRRSDLNCDGRVNLTDFSILLFYWQVVNPSNARSDINSSGLVDLTDFSILLYDWTG